MRIADFVNLELETRVRLLQEMTPDECARLFHDWTLWARPEQAPPPGDWIVWLILAGRGAARRAPAPKQCARRSGPTRSSISLGATADDDRDIMVLGKSGLAGLLPGPTNRPHYARAAARLSSGRAARSRNCLLAEKPDRLRGKQHMKLWCDELAAWRYPETFDQALLGLRLGDPPQAVVTTTPRATKIIKALAAREARSSPRGSTFANKALSRTPFSHGSPLATMAAPSASRSCSPRSSRRRRAPCGRAS